MHDPRPTSSRSTRRLRTLAGIAGLGAATLLAGLPTLATAQDRPASDAIGSDRPGLGDGAHVVGTGVWQLEAGATLQDGGDAEGVGSFLVRWGIAPLELRFYLPSPITSRGDAGVELGDLGVGVKTALSRGESWRWSLVGGATLPTGTDLATADEATGFATFVGETSLTESVAFALNVGYGAAFDGLGDGTISVIATPSFPLAGNVSAYAGYAGYFGSDAPDAHWLEAGIGVSKGTESQWDVNAGWDVESEAWFLGIGLATRWR